jgi:hypothetical protein
MSMTSSGDVESHDSGAGTGLIGSSKPFIPAVQAEVQVSGEVQSPVDKLAVAYHITQSEILASAGTWGDFSRYLQLLPGTVWNSDMSNDVMVRGGNPSENLYVVDGIEIPNINHIAVEGTTGGFTSMLDTSTISSVDMKPGAYDARYSSRLSSLIEIRTRERADHEQSGEVDFGISGIGGFLQRSFGHSSQLLLSAHHGVLDWATNDLGINGVPTYTNGLTQIQWDPTSKDHISFLSLSGADGIKIAPEACDHGETLRVDTQYSGIRSTEGFAWRHIQNPAVVSSISATYSTQGQNIAQEWQDNTLVYTPHCFPVQDSKTFPVYQEQSHDGISTLEYGLQLSRKH